MIIAIMAVSRIRLENGRNRYNNPQDLIMCLVRVIKVYAHGLQCPLVDVVHRSRQYLMERGGARKS